MEGDEFAGEGSSGQSAAASPRLRPTKGFPAERPKLSDEDAKRVIEAALFLGNRPFEVAELAVTAGCTKRKAGELLDSLKGDYALRDSALDLALDENSAQFRVRQKFLALVSHLSSEAEVSGKGLRILALIGKKGELLQSELKHYFKGEIYLYVQELTEKGFITSNKEGRSRVLKPTKKFFEHFEMVDRSQ